MKSLDEVILALERCTNYESECKGCPYYDENTGGLECEMRNLEEVLHFLKEYKEVAHNIAIAMCAYIVSKTKVEPDEHLHR